MDGLERSGPSEPAGNDANDHSLSPAAAVWRDARPCCGFVAHRRLSMRKSIILVITLIIYGFLLGEGWAAKVSIGGTHSRSEIQATCGAVGGDFFSIEGGNFGCTSRMRRRH
jgi:hypothetical protein